MYHNTILPHFVLYPGKDAVGVGGESLFSGTTLSTEANEPIGHSGLLLESAFRSQPAHVNEIVCLLQR